jgi:hypothetical protein
MLGGIFVVLSLSLVAAACSKSKQLEDKIADAMRSETNIKDIKVSCPGGVKASKGEKVTCTATGDFGSYISSLAGGGNLEINEVKVNVEFTDDNTFSPSLDSADLQSQVDSQRATSPSS